MVWAFFKKEPCPSWMFHDSSSACVRSEHHESFRVHYFKIHHLQKFWDRCAMEQPNIGNCSSGFPSFGDESGVHSKEFWPNRRKMDCSHWWGWHFGTYICDISFESSMWWQRFYQYDRNVTLVRTLTCVAFHYTCVGHEITVVLKAMIVVLKLERAKVLWW